MIEKKRVGMNYKDKYEAWCRIAKLRYENWVRRYGDNEKTFRKYEQKEEKNGE